MIRSASAESVAVEGAAHSRVKLLIYEDLQCSDCAAFRTLLDQQLLPRYGTRVRFEHRDFPLGKHAWARQAAIAARFFDNAQPGLGIAYRKHVLANLRAIGLHNFNAALSRFAKEHGVDAGQALAALANPTLAALVEKDYQEGIARGIAKTPTVLVNARPFIEAFTFDEIAQAIDAELAASN